jgi:hypothetical protein
MITLTSKIELYLKGGRKTALESGYRPLFNFVNAPTKISGRIDLIDVTPFEPGRTGFVKITFPEGVISGIESRIKQILPIWALCIGVTTPWVSTIFWL